MYKINLTLQNSKPPNNNLSKQGWKALEELQSDASIVILLADKGRSTVILNHEDYLEKCMDYINNGPYQLLRKDPATKIKAKTLLTRMSLNFMVNQKYASQEFLYILLFHTVAPHCIILKNK